MVLVLSENHLKNLEMTKKLKIKLSDYTPENWEKSIEEGYLPILAIKHPKKFEGTPIHMFWLSPKKMNPTEYRDYLDEKISLWKTINTLDVLSHVSCAPEGVTIFTEGYEEVLGEFLGISGSEIIYEYNRN